MSASTQTQEETTTSQDTRTAVNVLSVAPVESRPVSNTMNNQNNLQQPTCKICGGEVTSKFANKDIMYFHCAACDFLQNYYWEQRPTGDIAHELTHVNDAGRKEFWPAGEKEHMRQKGWELLELSSAPLAWWSRKVHTIAKKIPAYKNWVEKNAHAKLKNILDFGCGHGMSVIALHEEGFTIQGLDPYSPTDDPLIIKKDLLETAFPSASFDAVVSVETFEHITNILEVFREMHRILKPGGTLLVQTRRLEDQDYKDQQQKWFYLKEPTMHVSIYSETAFREIAQLTGFKEVAFRGVKFARFIAGR